MLALLCLVISALQQIIEVNNLLRQALERGMPINSLMETWDFLQVSDLTTMLAQQMSCVKSTPQLSNGC